MISSTYNYYTKRSSINYKQSSCLKSITTRNKSSNYHFFLKKIAFHDKRILDRRGKWHLNFFGGANR